MIFFQTGVSECGTIRIPNASTETNQVNFRNVLLLGLAAALCAELAISEEFDADPENFRMLIRNLQAGDTLNLAAGTYASGISIVNMHGTESEPITITGPMSGAPATFIANPSANTVQIDDSSFIEIRHLTLDGQGLSAPFGVNSRGVTHDITLEYLTIIGYSGSQATVGISTKGPAWNWTIGHNTIIGAGTGMYLGNSDGGFPFVAGLIEYNLIVNSIGYNIEIKHQSPRPTDIGMPDGVNNTTIRHNVLSKLKDAASGGNSRPNLLVGHFPLSDYGVDDVYEIYGNFFYQSPGEALFQGEGNIAFYNNLLVNDSGNAVNIRQHNGMPKLIRVFNNTIVASGTGISVSGGDSRYRQLVIGNAVFATNPIKAASQCDNITGGYVSANRYLNNAVGEPGDLDLYPQSGRLSAFPTDSSAIDIFTDWDLDFNGDKRDGSFRGAYSGSGRNSGWQPDLTIKSIRK